jgi:hypothetical protein
LVAQLGLGRAPLGLAELAQLAQLAELGKLVAQLVKGR